MTTLPSIYFGNLDYYKKISAEQEFQVEIHETYLKQTFRNRCVIHGANGSLNLIIPVKKVNGSKTITKDIEIDYSATWQKLHWKSITSAYRSSPYFEYFESEFIHHFNNKKHQFLIDLNADIQETILNILEWKKTFHQTIKFSVSNKTSFDKSWGRKKENQFDTYPIYDQVFKEQNQFIPNLSIIDLIFNQGKEIDDFLPH